MKSKYSLIFLCLCAKVCFTTPNSHAQSPYFNVVYTFSRPISVPPYSNADGAYPTGGLVSSGNTIFGTGFNGGSSGGGNIFRIDMDGSNFTNLYSFSSSNNDGGNSTSRLILSGSRLYGATEFGTTMGSGAIFALDTDGTGYTNLYRFSALLNGGAFGGSNSDGAHPYLDLALSGGTLFGGNNIRRDKRSRHTIQTWDKWRKFFRHAHLRRIRPQFLK